MTKVLDILLVSYLRHSVVIREITVEKETCFFVVVLTLKPFDVYVSSDYQPLLVYTTNNPLILWNNMKNKIHRLLNLGLFLQEYSLIIKHIHGVESVCSDVLLRIT